MTNQPKIKAEYAATDPDITRDIAMAIERFLIDGHKKSIEQGIDERTLRSSACQALMINLIAQSGAPLPVDTLREVANDAQRFICERLEKEVLGHGKINTDPSMN